MIYKRIRLDTITDYAIHFYGGVKDSLQFDGRGNGNHNRRSFHSHHLLGFSLMAGFVSVMDLTPGGVFYHLRVLQLRAWT